MEEVGFFAQVEFLVIACTLLFAIQVVFGWWRKCSSSVLIKYSLWLAYTCIPFVATYTLGYISSSIHAGCSPKALPQQDVGFLFLSSVLVFNALGSIFSMVAYDVDDSKQYTRPLVRHALCVLNMVAATRMALEQGDTGMMTSVIVLLFWPQTILSTFTCIMANGCTDKQSLYLQDYMKNEHMNTTNYDPVTLEGYNYLILDITVSQVWLSEEGIFKGSAGTRLKEVCLSYALSRLLRRRFFGVAFPEAKLQKTHDLVFRGLLSNVEEENYQAVYRVIETELSFTHDRFFITNPSFGPLIVAASVGGANLLIINFLTIYTVLSGDRCAIVAVIMLVLLALHLLQLYIYLSSDFARVILASWSITLLKDSIWSRILRVCNKLPQLFGCWQNKIGQHSLLKDLHSRSITADMMGSVSRIGNFLQPPPFPRGICNPGIKGPDGIPLTYGIKKAIAWTLKSSDGHLSNGASSLERNGQLQLSKEFLLENHATDLLIWHIATEYCDIAQSLQRLRQVDFASDHDVAASLSSYCAYLMAFVPELLPDHQLETTALFHRTRKEALQHLQKDKTLEDKYAKLSGNINHAQKPQQNENIGKPASQDVNIFEKGIQLGKRLEGITDDGRRWKILADFWTEMILYIAPSNNARDHIQHLANGGEFLTHLWALLTHAGILERGQQNVVNAQNAGANQPHQEQEQGLQPDQAHTEDAKNPVGHHEIEEEAATAGGQEADRGAHVDGNVGFSSLPAQGNYDSIASSSTNNQPRVEIV
ncbi:unnamed protein product [Urochloa decumbens]|uniref:DUF4220 domain-containing protein n=1 Tax=Urochloa decumbens TaxID=240449 RepID=A0ABC9FM77_9POAL